MKLFLDTSVLLAAFASSTGASHRVWRSADRNGWTLISSPYVLDEFERNFSQVSTSGTTELRNQIIASLVVLPDVFTLNRPVVFGPTKDRPILFSASAWADVLLTLDQGDFGGLIDRSFYELRIFKPGIFLQNERAAGRIR